MYVTRNMLPQGGEFDWSGFFTRQKAEEFFARTDTHQLVLQLRGLLVENRPLFTFVFSRMLRSLLEGMDLGGKSVLELGAGTGFLTRWMMHEGGASGVLVDSSADARRAYDQLPEESKARIEYVMADLFAYTTDRRFDIACSNGVIEHFTDKTEVLRAHRRHLADGGSILLLVPMDTPLTRIYYELHPELNLGYRELWTKNELCALLASHGMEVLKVETSRGYIYDMLGATCRDRKEGR